MSKPTYLQILQIIEGRKDLSPEQIAALYEAITGEIEEPDIYDELTRLRTEISGLLRRVIKIRDSATELDKSRLRHLTRDLDFALKRLNNSIGL